MSFRRLLLALFLIAGPPAPPPLAAAWDAGQAHLVVTWSAPGCVWLVGGPGADVVAPDGCGAAGAVQLGGGGDAAYQPDQHAALELRPWGDGDTARVAIPSRVYQVILPIAVRGGP